MSQNVKRCLVAAVASTLVVTFAKAVHQRSTSVPNASPSGPRGDESAIRAAQSTEMKSFDSPLRARAMNTFANGYFTVVSIVQGVVFGSWAVVTFRLASELSWTAQPGQSLGVALASTVTFLVVVVTSYMYFWFTVLMSWGPGILDVLVPMLLGASEMSLAANMNSEMQSQWVIALGAVGLLAGLAFHLSIARADQTVMNKDSSPDVDTYAVTTRLLARLRLLSFMVGGSDLCAGLLVGPFVELTWFQPNPGSTQYIISSLALLALFYMVFDSEKNLRTIFRANNVPVSKIWQRRQREPR